MICLRCGYCCTTLFLITVKDPTLGFCEDNFLVVGANGPERCPHLQGDKYGEYNCSIHETKIYKQTGCYEYQSHGGSRKCRMGEFLLKGHK
jgi:hypothetical protein